MFRLIGFDLLTYYDGGPPLKITKTHLITQYGTILELNIGNDIIFNPVQNEKIVLTQ